MFITTEPVLMSLSLHPCELSRSGFFLASVKSDPGFHGFCGGVGLAAPTVLRE